MLLIRRTENKVQNYPKTYIHLNVQSSFSQIRAILTKYIKIYLDSFRRIEELGIYFLLYRLEVYSYNTHKHKLIQFVTERITNYNQFYVDFKGGSMININPHMRTKNDNKMKSRLFICFKI